MVRIILVSLLFLVVGVGAQVPAGNKVFEVRNGNGIVDSGTAQAQAIYVVFRDASSKQELVDAFCDLGNFAGINQAQTPITKQQFAIRELQFLLRDKVRQNRERKEQAKIVTPDVSDLP